MAPLLSHTTDLRRLCSPLDGALHLPGEAGYDRTRQAWNLAVDQRPAAVVEAATDTDVEAAVRAAAAVGLRVAVQATGHRARALPDLEGTLLLRVGALRGVEVDPVRRIARVRAGTPAADLVAAAAEHDLAAVVGSAKDVSVAGFALGGGLSYLGRRHGLAANHVTAAEVVTADGVRQRADEDLLWALRGTGAALGAVTALDVRLHPVAGPVHAGMTIFEAAHAPALLSAWVAWSASAPEGITTGCKIMHVPPLEAFPAPLRGRSVVMIQGYSLDGPADAEALLGPLREIAAPIVDTWQPTPLTRLQDVHGDPEQPMPSTGLGVPLAALSDTTIDVLLRCAGPASGILAVDLRQLGGALARGPLEGGGAVDRVDARFLALGLAPVFDAAARPRLDAALDRLAAALAPWRAERTVATFAERPGDPGELYETGTRARLAAVRERHDPQHRFVASHPVD